MDAPSADPQVPATPSGILDCSSFKAEIKPSETKNHKNPTPVTMAAALHAIPGGGAASYTPPHHQRAPEPFVPS